MKQIIGLNSKQKNFSILWVQAGQIATAGVELTVDLFSHLQKPKLLFMHSSTAEVTV